MKNIKLLLLAAITAFTFNSCTDENEALGTPYVTFETQSMDIVFDQGASTSKSINIYAGNVTNNDRTINISVDGASDVDPAAYTIPTTVTIPSGSNVGVLNVDLTDVNLSPFSVSTLVLKIGANADIFASGDLTIGVSLNCPNNGVKLKMELGFDSWPEEASWTLTNTDTNTVVLQSATGAYAGMTGGITVQECLAAGNYRLDIADQYGDGGTSYAISADGSGVTSIGAASYASSSSVSFTL